MLDVHPPEHTPHSWRDFFIHIATIVIGLLIAIGLEQTVEYVHHRELVRQARANVLAEIRANRDTLAADQRDMVKVRALMLQNIAVLQNREKDPAAAEQIKFPVFWNGPRSAAYQTARDNGAMALMAYSDGQVISDVYSQQKVTNDDAVLYLRQMVSDESATVVHPRIAEMSDAEVQTLITGCAATVKSIDFLSVLTNGLDANYKDALDQIHE
jgi:hypothetical protein